MPGWGALRPSQAFVISARRSPEPLRRRSRVASPSAAGCRQPHHRPPRAGRPPERPPHCPPPAPHRPKDARPAAAATRAQAT
ncbi:hypothetical protein CY652_00535 [Burkholderia sp. WAC0059]|nr:hypothetical protein CY652_00535 [Burkholderia sp. WAC0059]